MRADHIEHNHVRDRVRAIDEHAIHFLAGTMDQLLNVRKGTVKTRVVNLWRIHQVVLIRFIIHASPIACITPRPQRWQSVTRFCRFSNLHDSQRIRYSLSRSFFLIKTLNDVQDCDHVIFGV